MRTAVVPLMNCIRPITLRVGEGFFLAQLGGLSFERPRRKIRVLMSPRPRQAGGANDNLQMCLCRRDWRNVNCIFFFIGHSGLAVCRDLKRQPVGALCPSQDACIAARPNVFHCFYQSSGLSLYGYPRCMASTGLIPRACNAIALNRKSKWRQ